MCNLFNHYQNEIMYKIKFLRYQLDFCKTKEERLFIQNEIQRLINNLPIFTMDEIKKYDGKNGRKAYVVINEIVYDVTNEQTWQENSHFNLKPGKDLTEEFNRCHNNPVLLNELSKVGRIKNE